MKDNMEASMYKELSYRVRGFRVVTCIVASVTVVLCLLIGIGTWILVSGVRENEKFITGVREHDITIIEGEIREPLIMGQSPQNNIDKVVPHMAEIDFKEGNPKTVDHSEFVPAVRMQNNDERPIVKIIPDHQAFIDPSVYKNNFAQKFDVANNIQSRNGQGIDFTVPEMVLIERQKKNSQSILDTLLSFTQQFGDENIKAFRTLGSQMFGYNFEEPATHRTERSVAPMMIGNALKYASYLGFAKYMYNEASAITEYKMESRKLSGDPEANFLDNLFWSKPTINQKPSRIDTVETTEVKQPDQPLIYGSDNWEPMTNQISLNFMSELLNTLLNIMREFLLRDNVMECLWFMFCQDVNHQAKYTDIYGVVARVNSVGLKVLTDREERETDTINDIWRAVSAYSPLQCDTMFPKCDGSKALEIVNDVASGSE